MKTKNKLFDWFKPIYGLLVVSLLISACGGRPTGQVEPTPIQLEASPTATVVPSPTPTPQPSVLNVCTAQEPASLYRYDGRNSESKKTSFSALYGSAILEHDELSILLERVPSIENGDVQVLAVEVAAGDVVVDATGQLTVLKRANSRYRRWKSGTNSKKACSGRMGNPLVQRMCFFRTKLPARRQRQPTSKSLT